jgi:hypothetical protein
VHDDFRIRVEVSREQAQELLRALQTHERDGAAGLPGPEHIAVSHEDGHVFLYADSEAEAARARAAVEMVLAEKRIAGQVSSWRWHAEEDRWEDASLPLPSTPAEHTAEHERLEREETEESERAGFPEWEVRVSLPTHHDARAFAERLAREGIPVKRHWRHLTLGAEDEDDANMLAERLRSESPQGSSVEVEGAAWPMWQAVNAPGRPFAIFGGLGQ